MVEHCPDWAKEIFWSGNSLNNGIIDTFNGFVWEDIKDNDTCVMAQLVAEWLELDQIDIFPLDQKSYWLIEFFKAERMIKSKGIRFFSDEV
jgi:hypothetical protein